MSIPPVSLVAAGPGHPGLLTLRAVECLRQADLVLYDKLVSPILLDHAPIKAEKHCVTELAPHDDARVAWWASEGGGPFFFGAAAEKKRRSCGRPAFGSRSCRASPRRSGRPRM